MRVRESNVTKTVKEKQKECKMEKLACLLHLRKAQSSAMKLMAGPVFQ